jgi:hypothetical protein
VVEKIESPRETVSRVEVVDSGEKGLGWIGVCGQCGLLGGLEQCSGRKQGVQGVCLSLHAVRF